MTLTPEEAKKMLENIQKYTVNMGVGSGTFMQMKNVHKLISAARIVERERCIEIMTEYISVEFPRKEAQEVARNLILTPNQDIV